MEAFSDRPNPEIMERLIAGDAEAAAALARQGENQWVELKSRLPQTAELVKHLAAFANSGGGVLIVGAGEHGQVLGWQAADADSAVRRLHSVSASTLPNLARVRRGQLEDGWLVWAVVSPADEPVVTAKGSYWIRRADRTWAAELPQPNVLTEDQPAGSGLPQAGPIRVFVAMSFREEEEPALVHYWQAMLRAAKQSRREFDLRRIDEIEGDYEIMERIYQEIDAAHLVIADLTLSPANVYLELGYARGRGKPVIQTCRKDTFLEFDVRGRRTLIYRNATILEEKLLRALDAL